MDYFSRFGIHDADNDLCCGMIGMGKECVDNRIDQRHTAAELTKTIVPILQNAHKINIVGKVAGEGEAA